MEQERLKKTGEILRWIGSAILTVALLGLMAPAWGSFPQWYWIGLFLPMAVVGLSISLYGSKLTLD